MMKLSTALCMVTNDPEKYKVGDALEPSNCPAKNFGWLEVIPKPVDK
jgi:hypothetical protein